MNKKIIIGIVGMAFVGTGAITLGALTFTPPVSYSAIEWTRPNTDLQWAEDVKKENFDIRSTKVLEIMIESHTAKLAREEIALKKYQDCPQCIYYEFYEGFIQSGYTEANAIVEATKQKDTAIAQRLWSVEKLKQSLERMDKEIDLRSRGKVTRNIYD